jgi:tRNA pseudouridine55 synthase
MPRQAIDGVLLLDKPAGMTSNAVLQKIKWLYNAAKAGHTGTLDPLATGLLPLCLGEATKFAGELLSADKTYLATVRLGIRTTTGDAEGAAVSQRDVDVTREQLQQVMSRFVGDISQVPPMYSALKYQGRNYYEYARAGIEIPRVAREVRIHELTLQSFAPPECVLQVRCSKGTYVRTLAEDIGEALGCGAHLAALRRTAIGDFAEAHTFTVAQIEAMPPAQRAEALLPVDTLIRHLPAWTLSADAALQVGMGRCVRGDSAPDGPCRLYDPEGRFLGLGEASAGDIRPKRLLASPAPQVTGVRGPGSPAGE